jgi:1-acyl-sn-glycerol-3-phosphate acyltransferase
MAAHTLRAWRERRISSPPTRARLVRRIACRTLRSLDVAVELGGSAPLVDGAALWVANHVSWLDVYVLNAVAGSRFVAKSEVRAWPIVGSTAARHGTFFLVRRSFRDAARVKDAIATALRAGDRVAVFPEGTTTDGHALRCFHAALLQAAIDAGAPIQPIALRYRDHAGRVSTAAPFIDDMTFGRSLARIVTAPMLTAELTFGPPIATPGRDRRDVTAAAERFVAGALGLPVLSSEATGRRALRRGAA